MGAGGVGLSAILAARLAGAATIVAVDPAETRRALAVELGATHAIDPAGAADGVRELTDGGADYAIESSGAAGAVPAAYAAVRTGRNAGVRRHPARRRHRRASRSGARARREGRDRAPTVRRPHTDMPMLLDLFMSGRLPLDRLVGATYPLEEIDRAFADMRDGAGVRTVIDLT